MKHPFEGLSFSSGLARLSAVRVSQALRAVRFFSAPVVPLELRLPISWEWETQ